MKIKLSDSCQYCGNTDTLEHFLFDCPIVKQLWHEIERRIESITNKHIHLDITNVILGLDKRNDLKKNVINEINWLLLIAKNTISKVKCYQNNNFLVVLDQEINHRKSKYSVLY